MEQIDVMNIIAYYLSEYDTMAFRALGYSTQTFGFNAISALFNRKSSYLRRLRDEYDVVTSSHRKGQRNRPPQKRILRVQSHFSSFSFEELTEIVRAFLQNKSPDRIEMNGGTLEYDISPKSEVELESILNFQDTSAAIRIKEGKNNIRVYNLSIIKQLKKIYGGRCQLCNHQAFDDFNTDISEAHHIEYFSLTQNNDSSNIIILCPNHHRLIHKLNPKYIPDERCFVFDNNHRIYVSLDFHLKR